MRGESSRVSKGEPHLILNLCTVQIASVSPCPPPITHTLTKTFQIYDMLNIKGLEERGESFYNPLLIGVIESLEDQGLAVESEGAKVVFLEGVSYISCIIVANAGCVSKDTHSHFLILCFCHGFIIV